MANQETQLKTANPLLVFSDDWGRHPSSCQHLIHHLLGDYSVTWVNTIGMRPPRLDLLTVKRGLEKLNGWIKPNKESNGSEPELPNGLKVIDAKMWPRMKNSWDRKINRHLLTKQLYDAAKNSVAITACWAFLTISVVRNTHKFEPGESCREILKKRINHNVKEL